MIVQCDVRGLEVVCAAYLSQDKVLYKELNNKVDIHQANQDAFDLPDRLIAKILKFRLLYGGSEYSFANDPNFTPVSTSTKYWKKVIEKYYTKYSGIAKWHDEIIREVSKTKKLTMFTGRTYEWDLNKYGEYKLPVTQIKNFPVQGCGADVVSIARVSLHKRWKRANIRGMLINTVHDSICFDVEKQEVSKVVDLTLGVFEDLPTNISRIFKVNWDLKTSVEILVGHNMLELKEIK